MNKFALVFTIVNVIALLTLPRRWAFLPLLVGTSYMTLGQGIEIGPFTFTIIRMLVAVGVLRVFLRSERLTGGTNGMDWLMLIWALWAVFSSFFHNDVSSALTFRLGLIYNACGIYFLLRIFCQSIEDITRLCKFTAILLFPVAVAMLYEKMTSNNLFSVLGGVSAIPEIREGRIRGQGPFAHSILAGTVGAVCIPFMIGLWKQHRNIAFIGLLSCLSIIMASSSSGPIMSAMAAIGALFLWHFRNEMRIVRWLAVFGYISLEIVMKAPAYFLISRIDIVGGSTGWHRSRLIQRAFENLHEWWFAGTDYTRHWMPTGVQWSGDHTDITNYYLKMGVIGGLPLMLLFILILYKGYSFLGQTMQQSSHLPREFRFMLWALGAALFAHTVTFIAVSYFDQSFVFIYLTLAAISSVHSAAEVSPGYESKRQEAPTSLALAETPAEEQHTR